MSSKEEIAKTLIVQFFEQRCIIFQFEDDPSVRCRLQWAVLLWREEKDRESQKQNRIWLDFFVFSLTRPSRFDFSSSECSFHHYLNSNSRIARLMPFDSEESLLSNCADAFFAKNLTVRKIRNTKKVRFSAIFRSYFDTYHHHTCPKVKKDDQFGIRIQIWLGNASKQAISPLSKAAIISKEYRWDVTFTHRQVFYWEQTFLVSMITISSNE